MRAVLVQLAEDVAGDDQRHALCLQLAKQLGEAAARIGVQTAGRLVQQQHAGLVHDGLADGHALALAARELGRVAVQQLGQAQLCGHLLHADSDLCGIHAHGQGRVLQAARDAEAVIEAVKVRQIAEVAVHLARLLLYGQAFDMDLPRQRLLQPGNAAHQCGLACAIGADQCGDAAGGDGQAHAVECAVARIFKHQL